MAALEIREIGDSDTNDLATLWERCGLTRPWNDPDADIAFARTNDNSTVLGGWIGDALVASAMVGHDGHRGTVYYVSVDPAHQGSGVGRTIMEAAEDWLRGRGVWKLNLMVRASNTRVIDFYRSLDYETEERANMSKWLDPARRPAQED